ncbi:MAG: PocR ligand-binding domain-containing protein [Eubacteriales bacterium]|nr:PocR ligand-binding domain-containing protein [Eubacteriales bacterium]MDD3197887.1 PocR ligand-binding domain-containing protein [Eubacteriales bacterium]
MSLIIAHDQMLELLRDFNKLTGIRIVVFDDNLNEILTYPKAHSKICSLIREQSGRYACCEECNRRSFETCRQSDRLVIYKCHAGLIEATCAIKLNGVVVGYIMFGQITESTDKKQLAQQMIEHFQISTEEAERWYQAVSETKTKSFSQVKAASKILEACTYYVLQKDLVALRHERLVDKINAYIDDNLGRNITVADLTADFSISRTKLYEILNQQLGIGIAEYIKRKRMERARQLLIETEMRIAEIAGLLGYDDYTYFSRVFRKEYSLSPRQYRNIYSGKQLGKK